jgi:DNA-directed RNA polymerase subunit RPC12/RpoP
MSETENIQCPDCGAAVRSGASFCFKCGKHFGLGGAGKEAAAVAADAVAAEPAAEPAPAEFSAGPQDFSETIPDTPAILLENNEGSPAPENEPSPVAKPAGVKAKPQLTSAAALRRKPKPQREKIEMVWEQPEGTSNPVFVIGTIVIFIFVLVILLIVYFVK